MNTEVTNEPVDAGLEVTDDPPDVAPEDPPDVWSRGGLCVSNLPVVFCLFVCLFVCFHFYAQMTYARSDLHHRPLRPN